MITGINLAEVKEYISKHDKEEPKTTWLLGSLDSEMFDVLGEGTNSLKQISDVVRLGLRGFKGFRSADGHDMPFVRVEEVIGGRRYLVVTDDIMRVIPPMVKAELGSEILKMSKVSEEEAKN